MSAPCNKSFSSGWFSAPRVPNDWSNEVTSSWKRQRECATPGSPSKSPVDYETVRRWRDRWYAAQARLQAIEATGKPKLLGQAIEVLLTDEQRPGAPATFTFEQFMQIMALACETPASADREVAHLDPARTGRRSSQTRHCRADFSSHGRTFFNR